MVEKGKRLLLLGPGTRVFRPGREGRLVRVETVLAGNVRLHNDYPEDQGVP